MTAYFKPLCRRQHIAACAAVMIAFCWGAAVLGDEDSRRAVPTAEEVRKATDLARQIYGEELKRATNPDAKELLARKMITAAAESGSEPTQQFAIFSMAIDQAIKANAAQLAAETIATLASTYQVDGEKMRTDALLKISHASKSKSDAAGLYEAASDASDEAMSANRFDAAIQFANIAVAAASQAGSAEMSKDAATALKQLEVQRDAYRTIATSLKTLAANPEDRAANLVVGRFQCFVRGDWKTGLPMIARGGDGDLNLLAARDIALDSAPPADKVRVADDWWNIAQKEGGPRGEEIRQHASSIYSSAFDALGSGLERMRLLKRIRQVSPSGRPRIFDWTIDRRFEGWDVSNGLAPRATNRGLEFRQAGNFSLRRHMTCSRITFDFTLTGCRAFNVRYGDTLYRVHLLSRYLGIGTSEDNLTQSPCHLEMQQHYELRIGPTADGLGAELADAKVARASDQIAIGPIEFRVQIDEPSLVISRIRFDP